MENKATLLQWLQSWYTSMCDGEWEHDEGLKIISSDNPGWIVRISLHDTVLEDVQLAYQLIEHSESDWYGISIQDSTFLGVGDPMKLELIIEKFKSLIEKDQL